MVKSQTSQNVKWQMIKCQHGMSIEQSAASCQVGSQSCDMSLNFVLSKFSLSHSVIIDLFCWFWILDSGLWTLHWDFTVDWPILIVLDSWFRHFTALHCTPLLSCESVFIFYGNMDLRPSGPVFCPTSSSVPARPLPLPPAASCQPAISGQLPVPQWSWSMVQNFEQAVTSNQTVRVWRHTNCLLFTEDELHCIFIMHVFLYVVFVGFHFWDFWVILDSKPCSFRFQ